MIETVQASRDLLPALESAIPPAIRVEVLSDRMRTIRSSIAEVELHLLLTMALVTMVVFLFLRNIRATLISSAVVPIAATPDVAGSQLGPAVVHRHIVTGTSHHPRGVMPVTGRYFGTANAFLSLTVGVEFSTPDSGFQTQVRATNS